MYLLCGGSIFINGLNTYVTLMKGILFPNIVLYIGSYIFGYVLMQRGIISFLTVNSLNKYETILFLIYFVFCHPNSFQIYDRQFKINPRYVRLSGRAGCRLQPFVSCVRNKFVFNLIFNFICVVKTHVPDLYYLYL